MANKSLDSMIAMSSTDGVNLFSDMIREICRQEIAKAQYNKMLPAVVTAFDNIAKTASIKLNGEGDTIPNVKNKSGEDLSIGSLVQILFINGSSSNFVIMIKN